MPTPAFREHKAQAKVCPQRQRFDAALQPSLHSRLSRAAGHRTGSPKHCAAPSHVPAVRNCWASGPCLSRCLIRPYPSFCKRGESCREALRYQESHLLDLFTKAPLRIAYDCSQKPFRAQFLCSLSRAAEAEASLGLGFRVLTRSSMPMSPSQSHAHPSLVERPAKWSKALNTRFAKFCHHGYHSHRSLQVSLCYAPRLT